MFTIICCLVIFDLCGLAHGLIYCIHAILITKDTAESFLKLKVAYFPQLLKCRGLSTYAVVFFYQESPQFVQLVTPVCGSPRLWTSLCEDAGTQPWLMDMLTETQQTFLPPTLVLLCSLGLSWTWEAEQGGSERLF